MPYNVWTRAVLPSRQYVDELTRCLRPVSSGHPTADSRIVSIPYSNGGAPCSLTDSTKLPPFAEYSKFKPDGSLKPGYCINAPVEWHRNWRSPTLGAPPNESSGSSEEYTDKDDEEGVSLGGSRRSGPGAADGDEAGGTKPLFGSNKAPNSDPGSSGEQPETSNREDCSMLASLP